MINPKENSNINTSQIKSYIVKTVAKEISNLVKPCYEPSLKKVYYDLLKITKIKDSDLKKYTKERWENTKYKTLNLQNDRISNFYVFLMTEVLKKGDVQLYQYLVIFYLIRHYNALLKKHFPKFCNPDVFRYALDIMTKSHIFVRDKTIGNGLYRLGMEISKRYEKDIKKDDTEAIALFINEARHRVSQSMKSFAQTYYTASEAGKGYKEQPESSSDGEQETYIPAEKSTRSIEEVTKSITIYKKVDIKSQEEARKLTNTASSISTLITQKLCQTKYTDLIKTIYSLFTKEMKNVSQICDKDYYPYVKSLMNIKRTKLQIYFKQQINILLIKILSEVNYKDEYDKLTNQSKYQLNLFLAFYLTLIFRRTLCHI